MDDLKKVKKTLVMKFGGASVATIAQFNDVANLIIEQMRVYSQIAVVISAMANTTDHLISLANAVNRNPPRREYDMLVSVGERISISLLAMALEAKNQQAKSFTGSQSGIITCSRHTDARIIDMRPHRLLPCLAEGKVVIVAGFQGVSQTGEITTLGRGGSDTTAVALALALGADLQFYKDVDGIFDYDPKKKEDARLYPCLSYREALAIMDSGAGILHPRCINLASENGLPMRVYSFKTNSCGTVITEPFQQRIDTPIYEEASKI